MKAASSTIIRFCRRFVMASRVLRVWLLGEIALGLLANGVGASVDLFPCPFNWFYHAPSMWFLVCKVCGGQRVKIAWLLVEYNKRFRAPTPPIPNSPQKFCINAPIFPPYIPTFIKYLPSSAPFFSPSAPSYILSNIYLIHRSVSL